MTACNDEALKVLETAAKGGSIANTNLVWSGDVDKALADVRCRLEALEQARKAWRDKATAESQLARLRGYRGRPTPGMKDDMNRWSRLLSEADANLRRVLGGAR